jgi:hypothetical protein
MTRIFHAESRSARGRDSVAGSLCFFAPARANIFPACGTKYFVGVIDANVLF